MQIVIINRTNVNQQIRKCNGELVTIEAYSPYILETVFKPEINFWTGCTDDRFIVATDIHMLPKLVAQLPKAVVEKQKDLIRDNKEPDKTAETETTDKVEEPTKEEPVAQVKEANEDKALKILDDAYKTNESILEEDIKNLKMNDLKILASKRGIEIPKYCKKAELIDLILETLPK